MDWHWIVMYACVLAGLALMYVGGWLAGRSWSRRQAKLPQVLPVHRVTVDRDRLRVVFRTYPEIGCEVVLDSAQLRREIYQWLDGGRPLLLNGGLVELYELPEGWGKLPAGDAGHDLACSSQRVVEGMPRRCSLPADHRGDHHSDSGYWWTEDYKGES